MPLNLKKAIARYAALLFLVGLGVFAYLGTYNRYWADDWCYNADLRELGFLGTLKGYTYITTYASNRYSLTLFSGLLYSLRLPGVQVMTLLNIVGLCLGLYWLVRNIAKIARVSLSGWSLAAITLLPVYYSIYLAPHLYQSLYWRSGSLPYFAPLVLGILVLALITHLSLLEKSSPWLTALAAVLAFLAGGFSEAACAMLITALVLLLGIAWRFRVHEWARRAMPVTLAALMAALLSMLALIFSPTSAQRLGLYGQPASLLELPFLILQYAFDFVKFSFLDLPLPHLAIAGTAFLLGYLLHSPEAGHSSARRVALLVAVILVLAFLLIAASYAPSAYIEQTPPHPRTRILPRFVLTLAVTLIAWIIGAFASQRRRSRRLYFAAALLFLLVSVYTLRSVTIAARNIPVYAERARAWDERAMQIENARVNGERQILVSAIDGAPVGGLRDFEVRGQGKPGYWINRCAARYYAVDAIDVGSP